MKVTRIITYEGTPERIKQQLAGDPKFKRFSDPAFGMRCLHDGTYGFATKITTSTIVIDKTNEGGPLFVRTPDGRWRQW